MAGSRKLPVLLTVSTAVYCLYADLTPIVGGSKIEELHPAAQESSAMSGSRLRAYSVDS